MSKILKLAVVSEISTVQKNKDVLEALKGYPFEIINAGMKNEHKDKTLTYIDTAFIAALLINIKKADFIVGGCGTGQGFMNAVMQYPNTFCGLITNPLDGWLFTKINGGNVISLALNKGYGWAGDIDLSFIFEKIFIADIGCGYPENRKISQKESRQLLQKMSTDFHIRFDKIIDRINEKVLSRVFDYPGIIELIDPVNICNEKIRNSLKVRLYKLKITY